MEGKTDWQKMAVVSELRQYKGAQWVNFADLVAAADLE